MENFDSTRNLLNRDNLVLGDGLDLTLDLGVSLGVVMGSERSDGLGGFTFGGVRAGRLGRVVVVDDSGVGDDYGLGGQVGRLVFTDTGSDPGGRSANGRLLGGRRVPISGRGLLGRRRRRSVSNRGLSRLFTISVTGDCSDRSNDSEDVGEDHDELLIGIGGYSE